MKSRKYNKIVINEQLVPLENPKSFFAWKTSENVFLIELM